jgi:hypothetical protein
LLIFMQKERHPDVAAQRLTVLITQHAAEVHQGRHQSSCG